MSHQNLLNNKLKCSSEIINCMIYVFLLLMFTKYVIILCCRINILNECLDVVYLRLQVDILR